ncbi:tyrosine-type recombinase/integrase [Angustibacter peucedani]
MAVVDVGTKPDGRRAQSQRTFTTRRDAAAWVTDARRSSREGATPLEQREVKEYLEGWLSDRRSIRPTTVRNYRDALAPVIRLLGDRGLQTIARADVDQVVTWMLTEGGPRHKGVGPTTVHLTLRVLRHAMQDAVRDGLVRQNVVDHVERPRRVPREMRTWTADEVAIFARRAKRDRYHAAWLLSLMGLRRGEVLGLRWADVQLAGRPQLTVRQSRVLVTSDDIVTSPPKTRRGARSLPLEPVVASALAAFAESQRADRGRAAAAYASSGLVVVNELGAPLRPDVYSDRFRRLAAEAGLPPIRLHDLRHTALTLMTLRGVPLPVVAAWAGHADAAFTLRTYAHSQPAALLDAGRKLALGGSDAP